MKKALQILYNYLAVTLIPMNLNCFYLLYHTNGIIISRVCFLINIVFIMGYSFSLVKNLKITLSALFGILLAADFIVVWYIVWFSHFKLSMPMGTAFTEMFFSIRDVYGLSFGVCLPANLLLIIKLFFDFRNRKLESPKRDRG